MSEQNVELVKGIYGAFASGDVPAVLGAFTDDIEWFEAEGMPYGGLHRGPDAVAQNVLARSQRTSRASRSHPSNSLDPTQPSRQSSATRAPARQPARRWTCRQSTSGYP